MPTTTPETPIGHDIEGHPIWLMFGAEGDAPADDETDEGTGETDETDDEPEEETVDTLKERLGKVEAALRKANKEAERLRLKGKKPAPKKPAQADQDDSEAEQWKARAIRSDAKAALMGAGFTGDAKAAARLIRTIDTAELEFEGDEIVGLDDAIDSLKEDFPGLFKDEKGDERKTERPALKRRLPRVTTADKGGGKEPAKKTARELRAERLIGGR